MWHSNCGSSKIDPNSQHSDIFLPAVKPDPSSWSAYSPAKWPKKEITCSESCLRGTELMIRIWMVGSSEVPTGPGARSQEEGTIASTVSGALVVAPKASTTIRFVPIPIETLAVGIHTLHGLRRGTGGKGASYIQLARLHFVQFVGKFHNVVLHETQFTFPNNTNPSMDLPLRAPSSPPDPLRGRCV